MSYPIKDIEGIGDVYGERLAQHGILTTDDILQRCQGPASRLLLARELDLSPDLLEKWTRMADLMRVKGVARQYSELLQAAGVAGVRDLRECRADVLLPRLLEVNQQQKLCKAPPVHREVASWIEHAGGLEPVLQG